MKLINLSLVLPRLLLQSIFLALGQIRANKMRSLLTTLGIIIGVASVTAVIASMTGLRTKVMGELESFGTNNIFIFPQRPRTGPLKRSPWYLMRFKPEQFDNLLANCPSVKYFTRLNGNRVNIRYHDEIVEEAQVTGLEPAWHKIEDRPILLGRPFNIVDEEQAAPVCLITEKLRDKLGLDRDCVGQQIFLGNRMHQVIGVVEPRKSGLGGGDSTEANLEAFVPFRTMFKRTHDMGHVVAASKTTEQAEEAKAEILFYLRKMRHIKPGEPDTFGVETVESFLKKAEEISAILTAVASGIVGISLLVGGIGIMNIMLVSVSERTREIGLRKAVGARPSEILLQFLVEAVTLCCIGGLLGLLAGQGITSAMVAIFQHQGEKLLDQAHIPLWAVGLAFGFSGAVGVIFGFFPALKAAVLDPIEALRHE